MKEFKRNYKDFRKEPLDRDEHIEFAKDLRKAQEILEPWANRLNNAYSVNGKEVAQLKTVLNLLSSKICNTQDTHYCRLANEGHPSPYYGDGKCAWI